MGAKCIFSVSTEGTTPGMAQREIIRRVEAHTGRKSGSWEVTMKVHSAPDKKRPPIEVVTFSDTPQLVYLLWNSLVTEAEPGMVNLVGKISAYTPRVTRTVRGTEYDFEDFCVRVGLSFDRRNVATGVVVDIEYRPCMAVSECDRLLSEVMGRIAEPLVPPPQATKDPSVSKAADTAYVFTRVTLDDEKAVNPKDLVPFSNRTAALLYAKLLKIV